MSGIKPHTRARFPVYTYKSAAWYRERAWALGVTSAIVLTFAVTPIGAFVVLGVPFETMRGLALLAIGGVVSLGLNFARVWHLRQARIQDVIERMER